MSYPAIHIAQLLLTKFKDQSHSQELMTNLKLQKMLYYEQGIFPTKVPAVSNLQKTKSST